MFQVAPYREGSFAIQDRSSGEFLHGCGTRRLEWAEQWCETANRDRTRSAKFLRVTAQSKPGTSLAVILNAIADFKEGKR